MADRKWTRLLHVAKRETGIDEAAYRALLAGAAGVSSAADITEWRQFDAAMKAFKTLGFHYAAAGRRKAELNAEKPGERSRDFITAKQEYYIRGLWDLASRVKDEASLRAVVRRVGKVDDLRFLYRENATKVILALRDIAEKAGYDPDGPGA